MELSFHSRLQTSTIHTSEPGCCPSVVRMCLIWFPESLCNRHLTCCYLTYRYRLNLHCRLLAPVQRDQLVVVAVAKAGAGAGEHAMFQKSQRLQRLQRPILLMRRLFQGNFVWEQRAS